MWTLPSGLEQWGEAAVRSANSCREPCKCSVMDNCEQIASQFSPLHRFFHLISKILTDFHYMQSRINKVVELVFRKNQAKPKFCLGE